MPPSAWTVLGIAAGMLALMVAEVAAVEVIALTGLGVLLALAALPGLTPFPEVTDLLGGFGNPAVITVGGMFVLSAGLIQTGGVDVLTDRLTQWGGAGRTRLLLAIMLVVGILSAFINNTPIVALMLPVVLGICGRRGEAPSRYLIPLSYASIFGGLCTLVGSSTNLLVSGLAEEAGEPPFGMFEFTPLGLIFAAVGGIYFLTIGARMLPERTSVTAAVSPEQRREYATIIEIKENSPLAGKRATEVHDERLRILEILRGEEVLPLGIDPEIRIGDRLVVSGRAQEIRDLVRSGTVRILPETEEANLHLQERHLHLVEVLVPPNSSYIGRTVGDAGFLRNFNAAVLGVQRRGRHIVRGIPDVRLRIGDTLLVQAGTQSLLHLRAQPDLVILDEVTKRLVRKEKGWLAVCIALAVVVLAGTGSMPLPALALLGGTAMILGGCLHLPEAQRAVDWGTLLLMGSMIGVGVAIEKTGAADAIAGGLLGIVERLGPYAIVAAIYLLTVVLTEMLSNAAAAALMVPIALAAADVGDLATRPLLFAVMFAAAASFSTPIGYQTNLMVYAPGGYRFADFLRAGLPLNLIYWGLATLLIPLFWPLTG